MIRISILASIAEYGYVWRDFKSFEDYIANFDFKNKKGKSSWNWYDFVDQDLIDDWDNLSLDNKALIFYAGSMTAEAKETAAAEQAGASY